LGANFAGHGLPSPGSYGSVGAGCGAAAAAEARLSVMRNWAPGDLGRSSSVAPFASASSRAM
jgi:hypothetical protein